MLKKIIFVLIFVLMFFVGNDIVNATCKYDENGTLDGFLDTCKPEKLVGETGSTMAIEDGFKGKINQWVTNLSLILGIFAVGGLVYAGILFQFAAGQDEKITKAKNIVKWTLIGFLLLISASGIIYLVINVIYGLGG